MVSLGVGFTCGYVVERCLDPRWSCITEVDEDERDLSAGESSDYLFASPRLRTTRTSQIVVVGLFGTLPSQA